METTTRTIIFPSGQNQFIQENVISNAQIRKVAIAIITSSAITGLFQKKPSHYQNLVCENFEYLAVVEL